MVSDLHKDFGQQPDPSKPANRHVTMDERSIYFPLMSPSDFKITDVAHCLSNICRYNGFVNRFYSVAQHSVMACELAEAVYGKGHIIAKCALIHDAAEAYLGDISSPLKAHLPDYQKLEKHVESVIMEALALQILPSNVWSEVSRFDIMCLHIESNQILMHKYPWIQDPDPLQFKSKAAQALLNGSVWNPPRAKMEMEKKLVEYGLLDRYTGHISHDPKHTNPLNN